jgi:hypothetical protein
MLAEPFVPATFAAVLRRALAGVALAALCASACAAPETFYGYDAGLGNDVRLPAHPVSDAARQAFLDRLDPGIVTETFEQIAVTPPAYALRNINLDFGSQTALLSGLGLVFDSPPPGTANPINGIPSGVYPTSGNRGWLSADDFELRFDQPQVALGFYGVDIGDFNGRLTLDLVHADQTTTHLLASSGVVNQGGSVQFFGVLSIAQPFVAVRFGNSAPSGYDGFVFDDLTIATASQLAPVPEPATGLGLLAGLGLMGRCLRRRGSPARSPAA